MGLDFRTMEPKAFMEIFPATIPISAVDHRAEISSGEVVRVAPPKFSGTYPTIRPSYETAQPVDLATFGETELARLGSKVLSIHGPETRLIT